MKLLIYHYQPLENYPPVMNDINDFMGIENGMKLNVVSSVGADSFNNNNAKIFRIGFKTSKNWFIRYLHYITYNFSGLIIGLINKPNKIMVYETYSILPTYIMSRIWSDISIHFHEHEYVSKDEIDKASRYFRFLDRLVKKMLLNKRMTVSQTNFDRGELYAADNKFLCESDVLIFPNLPPIEWIQKSRDSKVINPNLVKFVHVGALGLESTYLKEFIEWIIKFDGKYTVDFYLGSTNLEALSYLNKIIGRYKFISIHERISYYNLPSILCNYDVGLVLYKGAKPNETYSVPNKFMEYVVCGLNVWYSDKLLSTIKFSEKYNLGGVFKMNFASLNQLEIPEFSLFDNENAFQEIYKTNSKRTLLKS